MITDLLSKQPTLSFEVFPPKKDGEFEKAYETLDALAALEPDFISVTYGAGGSRSKKTVELASYIQNTLHIEALAHITCVGNSREDILGVADQLKEQHIGQVLALRGDRPRDMTDEQYDSRAFAHASDLISFLAEKASFHCAGACYPEKHFECSSMESDLQNLKTKQESGAEYFISQLFFDNDCYYRFLEGADKAGITVPVCAGIMPITTANQLGATVTLSGSSIPKDFSDLLARYHDSPENLRKAGVDYAVRQILDLRRNGVEHIHLYTMNRPRTAAEIAAGIR